MDISPTGKTLGATISDIDLARSLNEADFARIVAALGEHGVLCFPRQSLDASQLKRFAERFGRLQTSVTGKFSVPDVPEVGILSNVVENGELIGLADAGQDWHTDMTYNKTVGFTNVLYAVKVPRRDGRALGATQFANMHAAYDDLAPEWKDKLAHATATHDFNLATRFASTSSMKPRASES
jgi:taurine dioxygenase